MSRGSEKAADEALEWLNLQKYGSSKVSQAETIDYYENIIEGLRGRIETLREEMDGE